MDYNTVKPEIANTGPETQLCLGLAVSEQQIEELQRTGRGAPPPSEEALSVPRPAESDKKAKGKKGRRRAAQGKMRRQAQMPTILWKDKNGPVSGPENRAARSSFCVPVIKARLSSQSYTPKSTLAHTAHPWDFLVSGWSGNIRKGVTRIEYF